MWVLFDTAGVGGWEGFSLHGFTLRASPAVTHGVSPPGTVGEHGGSLLFSTCPLCYALRCIFTRGYAWCVSTGDRGCVRRRIPPCISCIICGQLHTL